MSAAAEWSSVAVAADVRVRLEGADAPLPASLARVVSEIWDQECQQRPSLFNGRVFCADTVGHHEIVGHWTEYRRVLAQIRRPSLFRQLGIRSLGVNGLIECAEGLVLGRRHPHAVYFPGCWQAAPAGTVEARNGDDLDLARQLLVELREEIGLQETDIVSMKPVIAIEHAETHIVDIGYLLRTSRPFSDIERLWNARGDDEYDQLQVLAPASLPDFLDPAVPTLMPSARLLLAAWLAAVEHSL